MSQSLRFSVARALKHSSRFRDATNNYKIPQGCDMSCENPAITGFLESFQARRVVVVVEAGRVVVVVKGGRDVVVVVVEAGRVVVVVEAGRVVVVVEAG